MKEPIDAIVVGGQRLVACCDCGAWLTQFRIEVTAPKRAAGIRLWSTPTHEFAGKPCPSKVVRVVRDD